MDSHMMVEVATIAGVVSAIVIAWGTVLMRSVNRNIAAQCKEAIHTEVHEMIDAGVIARLDVHRHQLDELISLHLDWDGKERRKP